MALSDIILPAGQIIVIKSSSTLSLNSNGVALNFGTVQRVNNLCDITTVGSSVMFNEAKATPFMIISGQIFYLVNEDDISMIETEAP